MLELTVLGPPHCTLGTSPLPLRPRRLLLLTYLLLEGPLDRGPLAALFWSHLETGEARAKLRLELHRLQHSVVGPWLRLAGERVGLEAECDARRVEEAVREQRWEEVVALSRGELLQGLADDAPGVQGWLEARREGFALQLREALEHSAEREERVGRVEAALTYRRRLLALEPMSEAYCDALILRLRALSRSGEAHTLETRFRERFQKELGYAPQLRSMVPGVQAALSHEVPVLPPRPPARPSLLDPPLVGREDLWAALDHWWASPTPVALLEGEAGIGKSHLAADWAQHHAANMTVVLQGVEMGRQVPYYALVEVLRHAPPERLHDLQPVWARELARVWPDWPGALDSDLGERPPAAGTALGLLEALSQALQLVVQDARLVLLEDVHWLDDATLGVLEHVLRRWGTGGNAPRFLATARPGERVESPQLHAWLLDLEGRNMLRRLPLTPLGELAVLKLIRQLSGSPHATGFARRLARLSGGNPYALLAFVQGLFEQGELALAPGGEWLLTLSLEALEAQLNPNLREVLLTAVTRRGEVVLRFLGTAALLTPPLDFEAVRQGAGLEEEQALDALEVALAHRWLRSSEGGGYRFGHDLLRRAVEAQLTPERARRLHLRLAAHLEHAGTSPAALAHHLEQGGERARAYPLWRAAAEQADVVWAHHEALKFLSHALACTDDVEQRTDLHLERGRHARFLNALTTWEAELDQAAALLHPMPGQPGGQRWAIQRTHLLWHRGERAAALAFSTPWLEPRASEEGVTLLHDRAWILLELGRPAEAQSALQAAQTALPDLSARLRANLLNTQASVCYELQDVPGGLACAQEAIALFRDLGNRPGMASALTTLACLHYLQQDALAERNALVWGLECAREAGHLHLQRSLLNLLALFCLRQAEGMEGLSYATEGLELCEDLQDSRGAAQFSEYLHALSGLRHAAGKGLEELGTAEPRV